MFSDAIGDCDSRAMVSLRHSMKDALIWLALVRARRTSYDSFCPRRGGLRALDRIPAMDRAGSPSSPVVALGLQAARCRDVVRLTA